MVKVKKESQTLIIWSPTTYYGICCLKPVELVKEQLVMSSYSLQKFLKKKKKHKYNKRTCTCIFEVVLGSRKLFAVFHSSLNPLPALTMNI